MGKFKAINNSQIFLLPPAIKEFVKDNYLARLISEVVDKPECHVPGFAQRALQGDLGRTKIFKIYGK